MRKFFALAAAALVVGLTAGTASAGPLYNLDVLGSTSLNGTYSDSLTVQANTTYYYQVVLDANIGATNGSNTETSAQGAVTLSMNVNDTSTRPIPVTFNNGALVNGFNQGTSEAVGTQGGTGISGIIPAQAPATYALGEVYTGTFTTGSQAATPSLSSLVDLSWGAFAGSVEINGSTHVFVTVAGEAGTDPVVDFNPLTLTTAPSVSAVPEPASVVMMGLGFVCVAGLMLVRRRRMA